MLKLKVIEGDFYFDDQIRKKAKIGDYGSFATMFFVFLAMTSLIYAMVSGDLEIFIVIPWILLICAFPAAAVMTLHSDYKHQLFDYKALYFLWQKTKGTEFGDDLLEIMFKKEIILVKESVAIHQAAQKLGIKYNAHDELMKEMKEYLHG